MSLTATAGPAVTITHIAQRTGFSAATVSRVLNGKGMGFISDATRREILQAAEELGYRSNRSRRSERFEKTQVIALWIRNPDAPYYAGILRALYDRASRAEYEIILRFFRDGHCRGEAEALPSNSWPVDAIFAADCRHMAQTFLSSEASRQVPLVGLGSDYPHSADHVAFDVECGVRAAVEHLVSIGCRRIVHLSGGASIEGVRTARAATYATVVRSAGLEPRFAHAADESRSAARQAIIEHVRFHGPMDGLFCLNDDMAIGAYRGLRDMNLRIPEDVALVGCDGIEDGEYLDVPLTTIVQPVGELCRVAWDVMQRRLDNPASPIQSVTLRPQLLVRASTRRGG
jgi:LacI family transcriptional regulator